MRNLLIFSFLILVMVSCRFLVEPPQPSANKITGLTTGELNYFAYQQGDTFSFINTQGKILDYKCSSRKQYKDSGTTKLDNITSTFISYGLDIYLKCLTDSIYNIDINYGGGGYVGGGGQMAVGLPNYMENYFGLAGDAYPDNLGEAYLDLNTTGCQLSANPMLSSVVCLDSILINSKTYYSVSKICLRNQSDEYGPIVYDTLYYNQQYGVLKYTVLAANEIWGRR